MAEASAVILLPGLHGTGALFEPFAAVIPGEIPRRIIDYPRRRALGYEALVRHLEEQLGDQREMVLVAESFSGAVALRYACAHPEQVRAVVLAASFVSSPVPTIFSWLGAPLALVCVPLPSVAIRIFLAGRRAPRGLVRSVRREVFSVSPHVIVHRMLMTTRVRAEGLLRECPVPVLCLAGTRDRLVGARAARRIGRVRPSVPISYLDSPHLLLQTRPMEAWKEIERFLGGPVSS
jgi:pimeloyl-ACP methyl ester carboxylesterase